MEKRALAAAGGALVASAGILWSLQALRYDALVEMVWCGSFGLGFLVVAIGLHRGAGARWIAAGLLLAAVPSFKWAKDDVMSGAFDSSWVLLGAGVCAAASVAAAASFIRIWRTSSTMALRVSFGVAAAAGVLMSIRTLGRFSGWSFAPFLAASGLLLLAFSASQVSLRVNPIE